MDFKMINDSMDDLFQSWKVVPLYLLLIYFGISIEHFNIQPLSFILDTLFIILVIWNFCKLYGINNNKINNMAFKFHSFYLILMPIIVGSFLSVENMMTLKQLLLGYVIAFILSLLLAYFSLMKVSNKRKVEKIYYRKSFQVMCYIILLLLVFFVGIRQYIDISFSFVLSSLTSDLTSFITCSLALVLLFATLSLLSYTYVIANENNVSLGCDGMLKSGKYFFKSTILSIVTLFLMYISSTYLNYFGDFLRLNSILTTHAFNVGIVYSALLIMSFLSLFYCVMTGIRGIMVSSNVLKVGWHIG